MCKIAQRFTALTLATSPLTVKKPDMNLPQECILMIRIFGHFSAKSGHANTKLAHPMGCLHTNYTKNNTLENSQIKQGINKKESNHITITYYDTVLRCPNLNLNHSSVTEKSHYWTNVQNCTTVYGPDPSHSTPNSENTRPEFTTAMYINDTNFWPVLSQIRTANTKLAHPMGCLHTNYTKNDTPENSQIQQGINLKESNYIKITYNDTGLHCSNLNLNRSSVTEKRHYWTNVQNCTTVYGPDPSLSTPNSENTRPEFTTAIYINNMICWTMLSQIRTASKKLAHPMGCLHTNYTKNNTPENSQIQHGINKK
jgi:hypothetical protein